MGCLPPKTTSKKGHQKQSIAIEDPVGLLPKPVDVLPEEMPGSRVTDRSSTISAKRTLVNECG